MKKIFFIFIVLISVFMLNSYAYADYMVKLSEGAIVPYSLDDDVIFPQERIYRVDEETANKMLENGYAERIEEIQPLVLFETCNDTYYSSQTYMSLMNIEALDSIDGTDNEVKIGIIDSGIYEEHPDFEGVTFGQGYNYVEDNDDTSDKYGHGTRVTGIIAAARNNSEGIAGIVQNAVVVPYVTVTTIDGVTTGDSGDLIECLVAAADDGCDIVNISLGFTLSSGHEGEASLVEEAVNYAVEKGVIIVAAAGNYGNTSNKNIYCYPASYDNVISVGSISSSYTLVSSSQQNDQINTVAFGSGIRSTNNSGGYTVSSGTSFAAPIITGILARVKAKYPDMTQAEMMEVVKGATVDLGDSGKDYYGYGLLMADEAVNYIECTHPVFISPVLSGDSFNFKMAAKTDLENASLVKGTYTQNGISSYNMENITFDDGVYYEEITLDSDNYLKIFVLDDIYGQKSLSQVKKYLQ